MSDKGHASEVAHARPDSPVDGETEHRRKERLGLLKPEPLMDRSESQRYILFPLRHPAMWDMYKKAVASFWTAEEVDFAFDARDYESLTTDEQHFVSHVLAFFAASDAIVNENLESNFVEEVTAPEARHFYGFQIAMENIHWEGYSFAITEVFRDQKQRAHMLNAVQTIPAVRAKTLWAVQWMDARRASFAERVVAFVCVELICFSGSFCAIDWLGTLGKMPGVRMLNELVSRDEGLHGDFGILMYSELQNKLPHATVLDIITSAVRNEEEFVHFLLPRKLRNNMSAGKMVEYIRANANIVASALGVPKEELPYPGVTNPFAFMIPRDLDRKTNMFEGRVGKYHRAKVLMNPDEKDIRFDADF